MKKSFKFILNTNNIILIISILSMVYFGYDMIKQIIESLNTKIEIGTELNVVKRFFNNIK